VEVTVVPYAVSVDVDVEMYTVSEVAAAEVEVSVMLVVVEWPEMVVSVGNWVVLVTVVAPAVV